MKKRIKDKLNNFIPVDTLKEKRKKKSEHDKKNYHEFYARSSMGEAEWRAIQAKHREH